MKAIIYNIFTCTLLLLACVLPTACSDWNEPEPVDVNINSPKDQNPELWASYMQVLNTYKQSKHYIACHQRRMYRGKLDGTIHPESISN